MNKLQKIDTISIIIIAGFSFAVFYHYILGTYLGLTYPYDTFLFRPDDKFMDFFNMLVSPYRDGKFHNVQFPFGQRLAQSFTIFPPNIGLAVFFTIFVSFFLCVNYSNLKISIKEQTIKQHKYRNKNAVNVDPLVIQLILIATFFSISMNYDIVIHIYISHLINLLRRSQFYNYQLH